ncbi:MAG: hypothetical protein NTV34_12795, partial [Proteobacteria bacterium]|nr:hypothetical protein [Pseudomonadota bacterium]
MCFSSDASLGVGAALLPVGVYCIQRSLKKDISYLPLATVPFFFGVQQIIEGFVWKGLESGDPQLVTRASLVFLAFALVFWPFWIPLSAVTIENHGRTRTANSIFAILGLAFGLYSYLP